MAVITLKDSNFEQEVLASETPRTGGFLGALVHALPDAFPDGGHHRAGAGRPDQGR